MIDIIVPVYNEGNNIKKTFDRILEEIKTEVQVIVVYDFDEDNTVPVIEKIKNDYRFDIRLEKNIYGKGALNAIKTGFSKAKEDVVLVIMADLSDSLTVVDEMYRKFKQGYDIICGSRYVKGGKQIGGPIIKKTFSRIAGVSLHYFIRIPTHDVTNSFKMYSKRILDAIEIESNGGFELGMELTVKAYINGYRIAEVPSIWYDRMEGQSRFKLWSWLPKYMKWYLLGIKGTWLKKWI